MRPIITLLTDFGTADGYVGEMKGVLLSAVRDAEIVDITHDVPPQDVEQARLTLARVWRRFPEGTVHVVVVDPGVGSARAALAVTSAARFLVGPDNGVLSPALLLPGARAVEIPIPPQASATFHGRDVFAPAAAALARGDGLDSLGRDAESPIVRRTTQPRRNADGSLQGEVITVDRFGNAITNLIGMHGGIVEFGTSAAAVCRTYAESRDGEAVAVVGSTGFIEIAIRNGNASDALGLRRGSPVIFKASR